MRVPAEHRPLRDGPGRRSPLRDREQRRAHRGRLPGRGQMRRLPRRRTFAFAVSAVCLAGSRSNGERSSRQRSLAPPSATKASLRRDLQVAVTRTRVVRWRIARCITQPRRGSSGRPTPRREPSPARDCCLTPHRITAAWWPLRRKFGSAGAATEPPLSRLQLARSRLAAQRAPRAGSIPASTRTPGQAPRSARFRAICLRLPLDVASRSSWPVQPACPGRTAH
jgi:hypothetical protein